MTPPRDPNDTRDAAPADTNRDSSRGAAPSSTRSDEDFAQGSEDAGTAAERRTSKKPEGRGEEDGEVRDGYRWDRATRSWMDHRGIDFTEDPSQLPHNLEHTGDGSKENPHLVRNVQRWS